jgi:HNH endonuclease
MAYAPSPFNAEHITPESQGGTSELDNLAQSCENCNGHKQIKTHAKDPQTGTLVALFHPRKELWNEHFVWAKDSVYMEGITPQGRATVICLHLNNASVLNMRRLLKLVGEHPPM